MVRQTQDRIEAATIHLSERITRFHEAVQISQSQHDSSSSRLEQSQTRIERQLQQILEARSRHTSPLISKSMDASSPDGRQTWMELGRLLRDEGITPEVISDNKSLLVKTMKKALENSVVSSQAASFSTAQEFQSCRSERDLRSDAILSNASMHLLGSSPRPDKTFLDRFQVPRDKCSESLERKENIDDGMKILIKSMTDAESTSDWTKTSTYIVNEDVHTFLDDDMQYFV